MHRKSLRHFALLITLGMLISGCSQLSNMVNSSPYGKIEGSIGNNLGDIGIGGTIKLMPEKYYKATQEKGITQEPSISLDISTENYKKFTLENIEPGKYFLDVTIALNPCFLGAPGQVFNGMIVSFMENWSPVGISLKDGSSIVTGKTDLYELSAGQSLKVDLQLPKCY